MAVQFSPTQIAMLEAGDFHRGQLFDIYMPEGSLHCWNQPGTITFDAVAYEDMYGRIDVPGGITCQADLVGETVSIEFDGSRINDDTDFVGRLADMSYHQTPIRIRDVILFFEGESRAALVVHEWHGLVDKPDFTENPDAPSSFVLSCEAGAYEYHRENQIKRSDSDQKRRAPGDRFFELTAAQSAQPYFPFGTSWKEVPGVRS